MADPFPSDGFRHYPGLLDRTAQQALAAAVLALLDEAPAYHATMPKSGRPMSVAMSNAGRFGWYSDRDGGYRYVERHPQTGRPWPAIPPAALGIWRQVAGWPDAPEC